MSTIYERAYLVIAAFSSSDATQGFLNHQRQRETYHLTLPAKYGSQISVSVRKNPQTGLHSTTNLDPLLQRAWAFQEQHMLTRCLIFSADELQWVCKSKTTCECGRVAVDPMVINQSSLLAACDATPLGDTTNGQLALQRLWHKSVNEYSMRKLTQADDRLPAISGLASRFGARMGSRYVAGLWQDSIIQDMAWKQVSATDGTCSPLPTDYRAPSFSWASIDYWSYYPFTTFHGDWHLIPSCSVLDVGTVVPGHNPFGKVSDAWITIQGPLARGSIELPVRSHLSCSIDQGATVDVFPDCACTDFSYVAHGEHDRRSVRRCGYSHPRGEFAKGASEDDHKRNHADEAGRTHEIAHSNLAQAFVWLLYLGTWKKVKTSRQDFECDRPIFLVLGKSPRDPKQYERIGYCDPFARTPPCFMPMAGFTTKTITIL